MPKPSQASPPPDGVSHAAVAVALARAGVRVRRRPSVCPIYYDHQPTTRVQCCVPTRADNRAVPICILRLFSTDRPIRRSFHRVVCVRCSLSLRCLFLSTSLRTRFRPPSKYFFSWGLYLRGLASFFFYLQQSGLCIMQTTSSAPTPSWPPEESANPPGAIHPHEHKNHFTKFSGLPRSSRRPRTPESITGRPSRAAGSAPSRWRSGR